MPQVVAWLTASEVLQRPFSPQLLREYISKLNWTETFWRLAALGASIANDDAPDSFVNRVENALAAAYWHQSAWVHAFASYYRANRNRPLVHEQAVYFLEAMVLLDGNEAGRVPTELDLALLFLFANDHVAGWQTPDEPSLEPEVAMMAELCHVGRFNRQPDALRELVRADLVFRTIPEHGPLADAGTRAAIEKGAFHGRTFAEYVRAIVVPLYFESSRWGTRETAGRFVGPIVDDDRWMEQTNLQGDAAKIVFDSLARSRADAQKAIKDSVRPNGLPHAPTIFIERPFVRLPDGKLCAASPWAVREHLRGGLWFRFFQAVKATTKDAEDWTTSFGLMFEQAARGIAEVAAKAPQFTDRLVMSEAVGDSDELEDVVLVDGNRVALVSAKSRLVKKEVARAAESRRGLVDWYESFFFALPQKKTNTTRKQRAGAIRLLDEKVSAIRAGKWERDGIPSDAEIFPVLLTFDQLGDNPAQYLWLDKRCSSLGVLRGKGVHPLTLMTLEGFESLLSLGGHGHSVVNLLAKKVAAADRHESLTTFLARYSPTGELLRMPFFTERFNALTGDTMKMLFPRSASFAESEAETAVEDVEILPDDAGTAN